MTLSVTCVGIVIWLGSFLSAMLFASIVSDENDRGEGYCISLILCCLVIAILATILLVNYGMI